MNVIFVSALVAVTSYLRIIKNQRFKDRLHIAIKSKEASQTSYVAIHKLTRLIYNFTPTFGFIVS